MECEERNERRRTLSSSSPSRTFFVSRVCMYPGLRVFTRTFFVAHSTARLAASCFTAVIGSDHSVNVLKGINCLAYQLWMSYTEPVAAARSRPKKISSHLKKKKQRKEHHNPHQHSYSQSTQYSPHHSVSYT